MSLKKRKLLGGSNRFRLMLTLGVGFLLPAAGLIYVNFSQLRSFERDKILEAAIRRDFQEWLAISEKQFNKKAYSLAENARDDFPSPDVPTSEKEKRLDEILSHCSCFAHVFLLDEKGIVYRSQPDQMSDKYFREEHESAAETYKGWFKIDGKSILENTRKKQRPLSFYSGSVKRSDGEFFMSTVLFPLPGVPKDRLVIGGASFDPYYLKRKLFPSMLEELLEKKLADEGGNPLAMSIYAGGIPRVDRK